MSILSVQSSVVAGHVGNSAAGPALQRLGFTVWRLDTVQFSNHPAYGQHTGHFAAAGALAALLDGLDALEGIKAERDKRLHSVFESLQR